MKLKNREIRSKATFRKGIITQVSDKSIWIDFYYEQPIKLSFDKFLELVYCEKEVEEEIRKRYEIQNIQERTDEL